MVHFKSPGRLPSWPSYRLPMSDNESTPPILVAILKSQGRTKECRTNQTRVLYDTSFHDGRQEEQAVERRKGICAP